MFDSADYNQDDFHCWDEADHMAGMAFEMYENGELSMALTQIQEAIDINPNNSAWHFNKGLTLDALERFEDAVQSYRHALTLSPDDPEILNSLAVDYTRTGQYDLALSTFEKIEKIDPGFEPGYCNRIITYTEIDRHDKAEEMFYLAQQINPDCPICFYNIGNSLFSRQEFERAIWCWKRTAELEPTHPQIHYRIAQACWAAGQMKEAKEHFLAELRKSPGDIDVILDYGIFLLKTEDYPAAREKFHRILELKPDLAIALFYLGELERTLGDEEQAQRYYYRAVRKDKKLVGPRFRLAQMALDAGDPDKTRKFIKAEHQLDISDNDVLIAMAGLFLRLAMFDEATDCLLQVVDEDKENADAFLSLGQTLALKGEYEGALQFYQHAISLGRKEPVVLAETAYLYLLNEQPDMATKTISVARLGDPTDRTARRLHRRIHTAILRERIETRLRQNRLYQKLILTWAGYKCRVRRVVNSKKRNRTQLSEEE